MTNIELTIDFPLATAFWPPIGPYTLKRLLRTLDVGTTDLYTTPEGKKALIGPTALFNGGIAAASPFPKLKDEGGDYYILSNSITVAPGVRNAAYTGIYILEPGQAFAFECNVPNVNLTSNICELPSDVPIKTLVIEIDETVKTLYVCPDGKKALTVRYDAQRFQSTGGGSILNLSGAARIYKLYLVPVGSVPDPTNQVQALTIGNNGGAVFAIDSYLEAGDSIVFETDNTAAGQRAFLMVLEIDAV